MIAPFVLAAAVAIPPRPSDYVTDNANALSSGASQRIRDELQRYEQTTKHRIIVWIGGTTGDVPLEDWTIRAAEQWKIGRKGMDDGAILFLFMTDHKVRIEVGYGLESALTDASSGEIIRNTVVPKMRAGDTDGAVQSGVDQMLLTITPSFASEIGHPLPQTSESTGSISPALAAVILVLIVFGLLLPLSVMMFVSRKARRGAWYWGSGAAGFTGGGWSSGGGGGGFSGGGFSGGGFGGGFGGGGASGSW